MPNKYKNAHNYSEIFLIVNDSKIVWVERKYLTIETPCILSSLLSIVKAGAAAARYFSPGFCCASYDNNN